MQSVTQVMEKPYSREEISRIKRVFAELREASKDPAVKEYVKKIRQDLKG